MASSLISADTVELLAFAKAVEQARPRFPDKQILAGQLTPLDWRTNLVGPPEWDGSRQLDDATKPLLDRALRYLTDYDESQRWYALFALKVNASLHAHQGRTSKSILDTLAGQVPQPPASLAPIAAQFDPTR